MATCQNVKQLKQISMSNKNYEPPTVEVFDVYVEKGFADSPCTINEWERKEF